MRDETIPMLMQSNPSVMEYVGLDANGHAMVLIDNEQQRAASLVPLGGIATGAEVAVSFIDGDPYQPLILGALVSPRVAEIDERVELVGKREVVLRCGPASIRLTPDGRVTIRGTRILSRSEGPNRVQGASVELN